jgi:hypothetical protein
MVDAENPNKLWQGDRDLNGLIERLVDIIEEMAAGAAATDVSANRAHSAVSVLTSALLKQGTISQDTATQIANLLKGEQPDAGA